MSYLELLSTTGVHMDLLPTTNMFHRQAQSGMSLNILHCTSRTSNKTHCFTVQIIWFQGKCFYQSRIRTQEPQAGFVAHHERPGRRQRTKFLNIP